MATKDTGGQAHKSQRSTEDEVDDATPAPDPATAERQEKLGEEVDDMLDEIDSVLEENAEEFVRGYVQKGGQ
jgi:ubiquitin-like protein Pup